MSKAVHCIADRERESLATESGLANEGCYRCYCSGRCNLLFVYDIFLAFRVSGDKGMLF